MEFRPIPATHFWLAARRAQQQHLDPGQANIVVETPLSESPGLILDKRSDHALVVAAFHWYWLHQNEQISTNSE